MKYGDPGLLLSDSLGCTDMETEYPALRLFVLTQRTVIEQRQGWFSILTLSIMPIVWVTLGQTPHVSKTQFPQVTWK